MMTEELEQQIARLKLQVQKMQAKLQSRQLATKDLSLESLILKWAGNDKVVPIHEFFNAVESSARLGNLSDINKIQIAVLKHTDAAREFYNAISELQAPEITWASFKKTFQSRVSVCDLISSTSISSKWLGRNRARRRKNLQICANI
jgi:hypothetical protein